VPTAAPFNLHVRVGDRRALRVAHLAFHDGGLGRGHAGNEREHEDKASNEAATHGEDGGRGSDRPQWHPRIFAVWASRLGDVDESRLPSPDRALRR
jgi:hypothetical protein